MTNKDNGGPAFPVAEDHCIADQFPWTQGMSLRDWFAANCIKASLGASLQMNINEHQAKEYARFAYMVADAMLEARK